MIFQSGKYTLRAPSAGSDAKPDKEQTEFFPAEINVRRIHTQSGHFPGFAPVEI